MRTLTLTFKTVAFVGGSNKNIPCYSSGTTIALNNYVNTENNGYDKGEWITHHFEWTLPSGWQTTTGQTGTFVSSSSISVIPPASSSATSISVRAKANTQYSQSSTLQITRNLEDFTIAGDPEIVCYESKRYTAPESSSGVTYTWQLPAGWTGVSNANYIDVVAKGASGNIVCTMTGCNQTKVSSPKAITVDIVSPGTVISGPPSSTVCTTGTTFTINGLSPLCSVLWRCGANLAIVSGQNTSSCTIRSTSSGYSTVNAKVITDCGSIELPTVNVWSGRPIVDPQAPLAYFNGDTYNNICNSQWYSTNMNIQPAGSYVEWSRIAATPSTTE